MSKHSYNQFDDDYLDKLDAKLSGGKSPADLVPYKRTIKEFINEFVPLWRKVKEDIDWMRIYKATNFNLQATALELELHPNTLKKRISALRQRLKIIARSNPPPKVQNGTHLKK